MPLYYTRREVANLNNFAKMYLLPTYMADWILPSTYHVPYVNIFCPESLPW
jgi:hypothetical protein